MRILDPMTLEKRFGRVVRQWRTEHGVTQEELAERLGLHRNYIGGIERGERNFSLEVMRRMGAAIGYEQSADLLDALKATAGGHQQLPEP